MIDEQDTDIEISAAVRAILDARPQFRVGDRVRIRVDHECTYCVEPRYVKCYAAALANDGRTALVVSVDPDTSHDPRSCFCNFSLGDAEDEDPAGMAMRHAHRYWVKYDERMPHDEPPMDGVDFDQHFAATELEPLI